MFHTHIHTHIISFVVVIMLAHSTYADLIGYWSFDDEAGATAAVDSISGSNATVMNSNVTFGNAGKFGTAANLNGGYLQLADNVAGTSPGETFSNLYNGDFTINIWVKPDSFPATSTWMPFFGDWNNPWSFAIYGFNTGVVSAYLSTPKDKQSTSNGNSNNRVALDSTAGTLKVDEWMMYSLTRDYDTGTFKAYINGAPIATQQSANFVNSPLFDYRAIQFGRKGDTGETFYGSFDEARVYNNIVSQSDLISLARNNNMDTSYLYLNHLISCDSIQGALNGESTNGVIATPGTGIGIAKTHRGGMDQKINLIGSDNDTTGIFLDISAQSSLHNNITGVWGAIKNNFCSNDDTLLKAPAGYDFFGAIGMHANSFLTYDLNSIRRDMKLSATAGMSFSTTVAMANCAAGDSGAVYSLVILSNEEDGLLRAYFQGDEVDFHKDDNGSWVLDLPESMSESMPAQITKDNPKNISFDVMPNADYLSLFMLTGDKSTCDHGMYLNPLLTFSNNDIVPEPTTWALMLFGLVGLVCARRFTIRK